MCRDSVLRPTILEGLFWGLNQTVSNLNAMFIVPQHSKVFPNQYYHSMPPNMIVRVEQQSDDKYDGARGYLLRDAMLQYRLNGQTGSGKTLLCWWTSTMLT